MNGLNRWLVCGVAIITALPLIIAKLNPHGEHGFVGSDGLAQQAIAEIAPSHRAWAAPWWEPPSAEIEGLLFSLQAAVGAGALAYCMGYFHGRNSERRTHVGTD